MKILIIHNLEPQDTSFNDPLLNAVSMFAEVSSVNYRNVPSASALNKQYAGVIISGSPLHYSNDVIDARLPFMHWVHEAAVPILGICLGHQNLARLFGGEMLTDIEKEDGMYPLDILHNDPLLAGISSGDKIREMHRVSVTLPAEFLQLASTASCHNQVMKHIVKPIYGMQFHPELSAVGHEMLGNFVGLANAYVTNPAVASV